MRRALLPLLGLFALAACGHHAAAPVTAAAPGLAADTDGGPDGAWRGSSTRFQADGRGCPSPGLINAQVQDRQFQLRWGSRAYVPAVIAADGTISGQSGEISLTGKFADGAIIADAVSPSCGLHFTLHRSR